MGKKRKEGWISREGRMTHHRLRQQLTRSRQTLERARADLEGKRGSIVYDHDRRRLYGRAANSLDLVLEDLAGVAALLDEIETTTTQGER